MSKDYDGFAIIELTRADVGLPQKRGFATDGDIGWDYLAGLRGVTVLEIGGVWYAAVAAEGDNALTIIDLSDVENPTAVSSLVHTPFPPTRTLLQDAQGVTSFEVNGEIWLAVAAHGSDAVQLIAVTDPASPRVDNYAKDGARPAPLNTSHTVLLRLARFILCHALRSSASMRSKACETWRRSPRTEGRTSSRRVTWTTLCS